MIFRGFTPELEVRAGGDGRTVFGRAVPYGVDQEIYSGLVERFRFGAFRAQIRAATRVVFARDHLPLGGTLIGRATMLEERQDGLYGEWRVSKTAVGDETLELIRDGVLDELSIGFREGQNKVDKNGVVERVTATLLEVASVIEGAYGRNAVVAGTRSRLSIHVPDGIEGAAADRSRLAAASKLAATLRPLPL